jgi:hypothetical protein
VRLGDQIERNETVADNAPYKVLLAIDGSADADRAAAYVARHGHQLGVGEFYVLNVQP